MRRPWRLGDAVAGSARKISAPEAHAPEGFEAMPITSAV
jgi:hypothetical protein